MPRDLELIRHSITRYQALRRFRDPLHLQQLNRLKQWQHERMEQTHAPMLAQEPGRSLVRYFLDDIYRGIDLSEVIGSLERALKVADKLFTDLSLIRMALEFNTLNGEVDEALTIALFETLQVSSIDTTTLAQAARLAGCEQDHLRSIALVGEFAEGLDTTVHNPMVYGAFKIAKLPARLGGLGKLYQLLDKGFTVIRALPDAERQIKQIVNQEHAIHVRLYED